MENGQREFLSCGSTSADFTGGAGFGRMEIGFDRDLGLTFRVVALVPRGLHVRVRGTGMITAGDLLVCAHADVDSI
jgi:hypothetical protein